MIVLKNWSLVEIMGKVRAEGNAFGHPRFGDGVFIHTSRITSLKVEGECIRLVTRSGSHYVLSMREINPFDLEESCAAAQLMKMKFPEGAWRECVRLVEEQREKLTKSGAVS